MLADSKERKKKIQTVSTNMILFIWLHLISQMLLFFMRNIAEVIWRRMCCTFLVALLCFPSIVMWTNVKLDCMIKVIALATKSVQTIAIGWFCLLTDWRIYISVFLDVVLFLFFPNITAQRVWLNVWPLSSVEDTRMNVLQRRSS